MHKDGAPTPFLQLHNHGSGVVVRAPQLHDKLELAAGAANLDATRVFGMGAIREKDALLL